MTDPTYPILSVLVADDDADGGDSLATLLRLYGHRVTLARSGAAALAAAAHDPPDVALLDLRMPAPNGWEVARQLRAGCPDGGKRPFLIALTGCAAPADRDRSTDAGFDLHLLKPAEPAFLAGVLERFRRVLGRPADYHLHDEPTGEPI